MEKRDLYDINRNLTGETIFKGEQVPENRYIVVVLAFIQNSDGKFLIQKRVERKGGKYASTEGHPKSGETSKEGIITEVYEELGIKLEKEELQLFYSGRTDENRAFWDDYYIKKDIEDLNSLKLQEDEVSSVQWLSEEEIRELIKEGKFFENDIEEFEILLDWLKNKGK